MNPLQTLHHHVNGAIERGEVRPVYDKANAPAFSSRIKKASTVDVCSSLSSSLRRLWMVGAFTATEFKRLDAKLCDKMDILTGN